MTKEEIKSKFSELKNTVVLIYLHDKYVYTIADSKNTFEIVSDGIKYTRFYFIDRPNITIIPYDEIIKVCAKSENKETVVTFGSDPELFFVRDGVMIPSTAVIERETDNVARDGFQLELHPRSNTCRQSAASYIKDAITSAKYMADKAGAKISFDVAHVVSDDVWKSSPKELKRFGCNPTENVYEKNQKRVTGMREKFRAGGGHIHIGSLNEREKNDLGTIVQLMDIVAGNTLVLLDRDPANITRRKNYGRAGEYRPKPYGVEYRVPSNFWLKHYVLWSLASGLVRNAVILYRNGRAKELIELFNMSDIRKAINNNDYDLAKKNFDKYAKYLKDNEIIFTSGISMHNVDNFYRWLANKKPLSKLGRLTDQTIYNHWMNLYASGADGFEGFISKQ